jgi:similar to stage IV sporulation protein
MIERFLRFVNGSLLVCACGSNISRFLNLCARHEIMFWKIQPDSPTQVSFYIRLQDLYELRPYLRKTKTRIHIRKKIGFPFFWQKYRARKLGIFVLLCVMAGVWVLSTRIWRIEIKGNSSLGEDAILEYLSAHNVTYGMPAKEIDNDG